MKLLISLLFTFTLSHSISEKVPVKSPAANVYVCVSPTSVAYHSYKNCKGLSRCTHEIIEVAEETAVKKYQKRKCKICY